MPVTSSGSNARVLVSPRMHVAEATPLKPAANAQSQDIFPEPSTRVDVVAASLEEIQYMKKNEQHLIRAKRRLEGQVRHLEARISDLVQRLEQYKTLYEQARQDAQCRGGGELEIQSLHQQLTCIQMLKDALNTENLELRRRLEVAEIAAGDDNKQAACCVVCMDNLANLVCLPCKHLAMCTYCGQQPDVKCCPICRGDIKEKMQIYTP